MGPSLIVPAGLLQRGESESDGRRSDEKGYHYFSLQVVDTEARRKEKMILLNGTYGCGGFAV